MLRHVKDNSRKNFIKERNNSNTYLDIWRFIKKLEMTVIDENCVNISQDFRVIKDSIGKTEEKINEIVSNIYGNTIRSKELHERLEDYVNHVQGCGWHNKDSDLLRGDEREILERSKLKGFVQALPYVGTAAVLAGLIHVGMNHLYGQELGAPEFGMYLDQHIRYMADYSKRQFEWFFLDSNFGPVRPRYEAMSRVLKWVGSDLLACSTVVGAVGTGYHFSLSKRGARKRINKMRKKAIPEITKSFVDRLNKDLTS